MKVMNRIVALICFGLVLLVCGGCGAMISNTPYVYVPGKNLYNGTEPLPVTVVINPLEDLRAEKTSERVPLVFIPLVPYAKSHYDRPEKVHKLMVEKLKPSEDFAHALMQEMKQNDYFSDIVLAQQSGGKKADLIVTGKIKRASVDTVLTAYGLTIFGVLPWAVGLPEGMIYNTLDIEYEMRRTYDNEVVWRCDVKGEWSKTLGFYYNYSKEDPYTGFNEILRKNLHNGLALLGDDIKSKPMGYWKR